MICTDFRLEKQIFYEVYLILNKEGTTHLGWVELGAVVGEGLTMFPISSKVGLTEKFGNHWSNMYYCINYKMQINLVWSVQSVFFH